MSVLVLTYLPPLHLQLKLDGFLLLLNEPRFSFPVPVTLSDAPPGFSSDSDCLRLWRLWQLEECSRARGSRLVQNHFMELWKSSAQLETADTTPTIKQKQRKIVFSAGREVKQSTVQGQGKRLQGNCDSTLKPQSCHWPTKKPTSATIRKTTFIMYSLLKRASSLQSCLLLRLPLELILLL